VDDSVNGIYEGLLAGCWTVGISKTSSYVGLNEQQLEELSTTELRLRLKRAYDALTSSGAHYVIDTIRDLPSVIDDINRRLTIGEKP
jgi:phosphonoacetaldehyde hydrolase